MKTRTLAVGLAAGWLGSCWLLMHSGLALVVEPTTGDKYCVNMLGEYLGLQPGSQALALLSTGSVLVALGLPGMCLGWLALVLVRRVRRH